MKPGFTIEHKRTSGRYGYKYVTTWSDVPVPGKAHLYAEGALPPNYPMPAIPIECYIWPTHVSLSVGLAEDGPVYHFGYSEEQIKDYRSRGLWLD